MKVFLFDPNLDGHHAEYAVYIARHLLENGDEVSLFTSASATSTQALDALRPALRLERFEPYGRSGRRTRLLARHYQLQRALQMGRAGRSDVFHHLFMDGSELAWLTATSRHDRSLATFATLFGLRHCIPLRIAPAPSPRATIASLVKRSALRRALTQHALKRIFVHSARIKSTLLDALGPNVDPAALVIVPDPAPPLNSARQAEARIRLDLPADTPLLLFFGGLRRDKGPDELLRTLASVHGDWRVVIAGEPLDFSAEHVQQLVDKLPMPTRVILRLGLVPDSEVDDYFAAVDGVILPYRRSFAGTSGVLQRATAASRPIVATDVGDVGATVRNHGLGLVVAPESREALAEGIVQLLASPDSFTNLVAQRALAYAQDTSAERMARDVRNAYIDQIHGRRA